MVNNFFDNKFKNIDEKNQLWIIYLKKVQIEFIGEGKQYVVIVFIIDHLNQHVLAAKAFKPNKANLNESITIHKIITELKKTINNKKPEKGTCIIVHTNQTNEFTNKKFADFINTQPFFIGSMSKHYPTRTTQLVDLFITLIQQKIEVYLKDKNLENIVYKSTEKYNSFINAVLNDLYAIHYQSLQELDQDIDDLDNEIIELTQNNANANGHHKDKS